MKTTLTIADNLVQALMEEAASSGQSFEQVVNETISRGLAEPPSTSGRKERYRVKTFNMGAPLVDLTKALQLAGELEDEEILRQMEQRSPLSRPE